MAVTSKESYCKTSGGSHIEQIASGFTADAEVSATINAAGFGFIPRIAKIQVVRTAGATDVIDMTLQGSLDGTTWEDIASVTDLSVTPFADEHDVHSAKFRLICNTVGAANTLTCYLLLSNN